MSKYRATILKVFTRRHSLMLSSDAIKFLEQTCAKHGVTDEELEPSMDLLAKEYISDQDAPPIVSKERLAKAYERLADQRGSAGVMDEDEDEEEELKDRSAYLKVIDAFHMPKIDWDESRKGFAKAERPPSFTAPAVSKAQYLRTRYNILKQVTLRNEHFCPPTVINQGERERESYMKLTGIKNLLGRAGSRFLIFGYLSRGEDGAFYLEDLDDRVELDLANATAAEGIFTEGSFVLVDGDYTTDGILKVLEIGHPPSEHREVSRGMYAHIDFLGSGTVSLTEESSLSKVLPQLSAQFLIISDLNLDHPKTLVAFARVLDGYEKADYSNRPVGMILCGNFCSGEWRGGGGGVNKFRENFDNLGLLLSRYPNIISTTHLIFIPGPFDPYPTPILPRQKLPRSLTQPLENRLANSLPIGIVPKGITFGSNPCRIVYAGKELVVFREDLMSRMVRNCVKGERLEGEMEMRRHLVQTVLDQCHLSPLPLHIRPVLWDYDHTLRLYPAPTALALCDRHPPYQLVYNRDQSANPPRQGCSVFNPGSFYGGRGRSLGTDCDSEFGWMCWFPAEGLVQESELPPR